jgi:hypothetical protein
MCSIKGVPWRGPLGTNKWNGVNWKGSIARSPEGEKLKGPLKLGPCRQPLEGVRCNGIVWGSPERVPRGGSLEGHPWGVALKGVPWSVDCRGHLEGIKCIFRL